LSARANLFVVLPTTTRARASLHPLDAMLLQGIALAVLPPRPVVVVPPSAAERSSHSSSSSSSSPSTPEHFALAALGAAAGGKRRLNPFLRFGLPLILFCVTGYVVLGTVRRRPSCNPFTPPSPPHPHPHPKPTSLFSLPLSQLVENKVEAVDSRVQRSSARAVQLQLAHAVVVGRLGNTADYDIKPIPRPPEDGDEDAAVDADGRGGKAAAAAAAAARMK
jgi:hypothetical protein